MALVACKDAVCLFWLPSCVEKRGALWRFISLLNGCFTKSYSDFDGIVTNAAIQPDNKATERI